MMADGTVVAADSDRDRVWLLGPLETTARQVGLKVGDEPGRVIEGPLGRAFVALRGSGEVAEINSSTAQLVARHAACGAPRGMGWSEGKRVLTVACANGSLARLSFGLTGGSLVPGPRLVQHPHADLRDVVQRADDVLVSSFRDAKVFEVADDGTATEVAFAEDPLVSDDAGGGPPVSKQVAWRMVATSNGARLVYQEEALFPLERAGCLGASYGSGPVQPVRTRVASVTGPAVYSFANFQAVSVDLAVAPSGNFAVVSAANNTVTRVTAPNIAVETYQRGEPTAVAYRGEELVIFSREPAELQFVSPAAGAQLRAVALPGASVASTAHQLFHRATAAGIACASCHPEGQDDGHTWSLPEGLRRTNSLRGGLKTSAPFHWQGDRRDIDAVLDDVMVRRMGGEMPSLAGSAALLDWMDAMPALPSPDDLDPAAVARGKVLFESSATGCLTCHAGALGTNNTNASVGTGEAFQVPRLIGLSSRAPYFHDGSVKTLDERFDPKGGGELHGHTAALSAAQRGDLVEYLRSR